MDYSRVRITHQAMIFLKFRNFSPKFGKKIFTKIDDLTVTHLAKLLKIWKFIFKAFSKTFFLYLYEHTRLVPHRRRNNPKKSLKNWFENSS